MSVSLSTVASALSTVVAVAENSKKLYVYAAGLITLVEDAYAGVVNAGASKKAAVLAALEVFAKAIGADFSAIKEAISAWIDSVKETYNTLVGNTAATA